MELHKDAARIEALLEAAVLDTEDLAAWAGSVVDDLDEPPEQIVDIAWEGDANSRRASLIGLLWESTMPVDAEYYRNLVLAALLLAEEHTPLHWSVVVRRAAEYSDKWNGRWQCEMFYEWLTELASGAETEGLQKSQRRYLRSALANELRELEEQLTKVRAVSPSLKRPEVFCDFNAGTEHGGYRLESAGTVADLANHGFSLETAVGHGFLFYMGDARPNGEPDDLMLKGVVQHDGRGFVAVPTVGCFFWRSERCDD